MFKRKGLKLGIGLTFIFCAAFSNSGCFAQAAQTSIKELILDSSTTTRKFSENHKGIDIKPTTKNKEIKSCYDGVVEFAGTDLNRPDLGIYCIIKKDGTENDSVLVAHMADCCVEMNNKITKNQVIGHIGKSGNVVGECCHVEIKVNGTNTDPEKIIV